MPILSQNLYLVLDTNIHVVSLFRFALRIFLLKFQFPPFAIWNFKILVWISDIGREIIHDLGRRYPATLFQDSNNCAETPNHAVTFLNAKWQGDVRNYCDTRRKHEYKRAPIPHLFRPRQEKTVFTKPSFPSTFFKGLWNKQIGSVWLVLFSIYLVVSGKDLKHVKKSCTNPKQSHLFTHMHIMWH